VKNLKSGTKTVEKNNGRKGALSETKRYLFHKKSEEKTTEKFGSGGG